MFKATEHRTRWCIMASVCFAFALTTAAFAQVSFKEIKPPDDAMEYSSVYSKIVFASDSSGFLFGEQSLDEDKATVAVTHDGGATWEVQKGLSQRRLMGGTFFDENNGWAVGEGGTVLATVNGGKDWRLQTSKVTVDLQRAFFLTDKEGWIVGNNSTVLHTTSGGRSWETLQGGVPSGEVGEGEVTYMGVHFFDKRNGVVVGAGIVGEIQTTKDGGKTWTKVHESEDNYGGLAFADANNGWAVGKFGLVHATTDGGKNWAPQDSGTEEDLWDVSVAGPQTVWFSGDLGTVGYTTDAGATWSLLGVEVMFFGQKKTLTRPVLGVSTVGNKAWALTDYGRVLYFELN